jgi:hypothetical protein
MALRIQLELTCDQDGCGASLVHRNALGSGPHDKDLMNVARDLGWWVSDAALRALCPEHMNTGNRTVS